MKKIVWLAVMIVLSTFMLSACKKEKNEKIELPIYDIENHAFETHKVELSDIEDKYIAKASIGYLEVKALTFSGQNGVVYSISCKAGDTVKKGDSLITVTNSSLTNDYDSQKNKVELARLKVESLKQSGADSFAIKNAEADYEIEKINLSKIENKLTDYTIKAPFDGVIQNLCETTQGMSVNSGTILCTIAKSDSLCVYFNSDGMDNFRFGQDVTVTCGENTANAKVVSVPSDSPNPSRWNSANAVIFKLENTDLKTWVDVNKEVANIGSILDKNLTSPTLIANAEVVLIKDSRQSVMTVPTSAIAYKNERPYVYVYKNATKIQTFIETGLITASTAEVTKGLAIGDEVILSTASSSHNTNQNQEHDGNFNGQTPIQPR